MNDRFTSAAAPAAAVESRSNAAAYQSGGRAAALLNCAAAAALAMVFHISAAAQVVTSTHAGVVVAHEHRLELRGGWKAEGVAHATAIVANDERVVVLDALNNQAVIADLESGRTERIRTAETPIAAAFAGRELYILARDGGVVQHVGGNDIRVQADFLESVNGKLYAYSRATGVIHELGGRQFQAKPFASDFELTGNSAYLTYPREARVRVVDLTSGEMGEVAVGAVPVDLAFAGGGTALSARIVAVADPSAKRVWMTESTQSTAQAVARGFLRGFLGLGLFGNRASQFPTGVDRVLTRGRMWVAYDSSSRSLYHFTTKKSTLLAKNVAPHAFALTENGVVWWNGTSVAEKRLR